MSHELLALMHLECAHDLTTLNITWGERESQIEKKRDRESESESERDRKRIREGSERNQISIIIIIIIKVHASHGKGLKHFCIGTLILG